jgi:uncharacterized protein YbbC (DUF1343 family)
MLRAMEVAAERGLRFVVLDRPNPLGAVAADGPVLDPALRSFVNYHELPVLHGMTLGELAGLLNDEREVGARLEVVRVSGWRRDMDWAATGLRWVAPSPNLRTPDQARLYPAVGLLESTNVSVGRGTETPFEVVGAPWMDGSAVVGALGDAGLPGVRLEPTRFVPRRGPHRGRRCGGVRLTVDPPGAFRPVRVGLSLAAALGRLYPNRWNDERLPLTVGRVDVVEALRNGRNVEAIEASWREALEAFEARRARHLLY